MKPAQKTIVKKNTKHGHSKADPPATVARRADPKPQSSIGRKLPSGSSGPKLATDQPLTPEEKTGILNLLLGDLTARSKADLWINSAPSIDEFDRVASLPEAKVLNWMDRAINARSDRASSHLPSKYVRHVFDFILERCRERDDRFFAGIATLLRARKTGQRVSPKELGYAEQPGRKMKPYDLGHAGDIAVTRILQYRLFPDGPNGKGFRITRDELQHEIRLVRERYGLKKSDSKVSEFELSRIITKHKLRPFMAKR